MRPISPPATASSGSVAGKQRINDTFSPSRSASRTTVRDDGYAHRAAPAVEDRFVHSTSRRASVAPEYADAKPRRGVDEETEMEGPASPVDDGGDRVIKMLCDSEGGGFHMLLDRIKQDVNSTKEAVAFLRRRAAIEEEYGKAMTKLAQSANLPSGTGKTEGKAGSFGWAWARFTAVHDQVGDIHTKYASTILEHAEELAALHKNTERSRKQLKDACHRHEKTVVDAESALEKAKSRYEATSTEWEKTIVSKSASAGGLAAKSLTNRWKSQTPAKLHKAEVDARTKAAQLNVAYKTQLQQTQAIRNEYTSQHLPRFIRLLKDTNDQCDEGLQIHLLDYARATEAAVLKEATTLSPLDAADAGARAEGLVGALEKIDNDRDFEAYAEEFIRTTDPTKLGLSYAGTSSSTLAQPDLFPHGRPSFGLSLEALMERDEVPVPHVVTKCIDYVETHGLTTEGIYRISGPSMMVQRIRSLLDRDCDVADIRSLNPDVHSVCGAFKLYFRELPDPLFPRSMYHLLIEAARIENPEQRLVATHELINDLPDANYATLQALAGHLHRIHRHNARTNMTATNLSIIWGPTLLDAPSSVTTLEQSDIVLQTRIIELVVDNFLHIFDTGNEIG
ncbi:hypothetical protein HDU89_005753 [Geranomyces variabilis]|nr:hypothetical protein HDU89_005753 [Geranomyces variabilis]